MRKIFAVLALTTISASMMPWITPASAADVPCLRTGQIYGWRALPDDRTLIVTDLQGSRFRVSLDGVCQYLEYRMQLGFAPFGRSRLSCLARGDKIVAVPSMGTPGQRCFVTKVEPYTAAMEKADASTKPHS